METTNIDPLFRKSVAKIQRVTTELKRYLYEVVDWSDRLIIIKGARGVGKTTLLLQFIRETHGISEEVLYVSLDDIWFADQRLVDLAEQFSNQGGKYLFLDEVHKYPDWSQEVKNIYDDHPDLQLVLTSSSALHIHQGKADLSRRAIIYEMNDLSLREFLFLQDNLRFPSFSFEEILKDHLAISAEITQDLKPVKALKAYYATGSYPYFSENPDNYHWRLQSVVNTTLEVDLPAVLNIDHHSVLKLKKLLYVIATSVPFKPNISALSEKVGVARDTLLRYLRYLEEAQLIRLLHSDKRGMSYLSKPDKIYLHNTDLLAALTGYQPAVGTMRETFFLDQVAPVVPVTMSSKSDFLVDGQYIIEVGGKNKTAHQLKGLSRAFIVADDMAIGNHQKIPLWLFGFLY